MKQLMAFYILSVGFPEKKQKPLKPNIIHMLKLDCNQDFNKESRQSRESSLAREIIRDFHQRTYSKDARIAASN